MSSRVELERERDKVLLEFFRSKSEVWEALKGELMLAKSNAITQLTSKGCDDYRWYAGEVAAYDVMLGLEGKYKRMPEIKDDRP